MIPYLVRIVDKISIWNAMFIKKKAVIITAILLLLIKFTTLSSAAVSVLDENGASFQQFNDFYNFFDKKITLLPDKATTKELPRPYDFLLNQPLMTIGVEEYYQRTPKIKVINALRNKKSNTYSRAVIMLIDKDKARNNVSIAQTKKNEVVVEFALITMNFNALPETIITGVLSSDVPFGKLLAKNKIRTFSKDKHYFSVNCEAFIAKYLHCNAGNKLFGRTNTLVNADNGKWLAYVVELLSGTRCKEKNCQFLTAKGKN